MNFFKFLQRWFSRGKGPEPAQAEPQRGASEPAGAINALEAVEPMSAEACSAQPYPHDENLLERARTQWQFGDWTSLTTIERETLQQHPDRAKLALLVAAGHLQQGKSETARQFIRLAQGWGCSPKLVTQVLISGAHNTLGRAAISAGQQNRALPHFERAIAIGTPGSDTRLFTQARMAQQGQQLSLATQASTAGIASNKVDS